MRRKTRKLRRPPAGSTPGTLAIDPAAPKPAIKIIAYGREEFQEMPVSDPEDINRHLGRAPVTWVDVDGLGDEATLRRIAELFNLHPLALEDVVHVHQRAKLEVFAAHLYVVSRMVVRAEPFETEQLSIFIGENFVLTFQEKPGGDCFGAVRDRLRQNRGRIRAGGPDHLAYALLDASIDAYFPVIEQIGDRLETMETEVLDNPGPQAIARVHELKRELLQLRRALWPLREALAALSRDESGMIHDETRPFLRDCYDHTIQLIDLVENQRELCADLNDLYLSSLSQRMNEVMKVLTLISTIFLPLSFIAGIYGMNFNTDSPANMPELNWHYGYLFALGVMLLTAAGMLWYFARLGWLRKK